MRAERSAVWTAAKAFCPQRNAFEAEAASLADSATNRRPKRRFACTDGFRPVMFLIEPLDESTELRKEATCPGLS